MRELKSNKLVIEDPAYHNVLMCPYCGEQYLHQMGVEAFVPKYEDSCSGIYSTIWMGRTEKLPEKGHHNKCRGVSDSYMPLTHERNNDNPSERRQGMNISFFCEICNNTPTLSIAQHKGQTIIQWSDSLARVKDV